MFAILKRFRPYLMLLRPYLPQAIMSVVCGLLAGAATGLGFPMLMYKVLPQFFRGHDLQAPELSTARLIFLCSLFFWTSLIRGGSGFAQQYFTGFCGQKILERIRVQIFDKLQSLHLAFFHQRPPGDLISRAMTDTIVLQMSTIEIAIDGIRQPFTLVSAVIALIVLCIRSHDAVFILIFFLAVPAIALPLRALARRLRKKAGALQNQLGGLTQNLSQNLAATKEIRTFCLEQREHDRFEAAVRQTSRGFLKVVKYNLFVSPVIEAIASLGIGLALAYAYKAFIPWETILALGTAFYACYDPVKRLGMLNSKMQQGIAALDRIESLLNEPVAILDPEKPVDLGRLDGRIVFENVCFAYQQEDVLHDVNLKLAAHETYAIVGPSGAGKTTFVSLLPRFYDPTAGRVLIDGHDLRTMRLADLRRNIALVSQDPVLFNDTVYQNILVGKLNATREEVLAAAKKAYAHEFIEGLEGGYEAMVGTQGAGLSGGQKQRIAIARAFLKDAPILILDEATSALDAQSERMIQLALAELMTGRTVLIIAHRFSSIRHAKHILVFERGRVVERGSHEELAQRGGVYTDLYSAQGT